MIFIIDKSVLLLNTIIWWRTQNELDYEHVDCEHVDMNMYLVMLMVDIINVMWKSHFCPKKSAVCCDFFKMSKHELIYISSAIFYIISLFHETLSVFHYSSLSLKISKKCLCWGTIGMYLSNGAEYGYVVIMMKLNMYVMSMLTFRRSKIGENWKLQPVCCYHDDSEHVCYKYADL